MNLRRQFPASAFPTVADDVPLEFDADTDERPTYVTPSDLDAALAPILAAVAEILDHVGPSAQKHRARREAGLLSAVVAAVGCLGLGALALQGVSDAVVGMLTAVVLTAVVGVIAVVGRIQLVAKAPGVSVDAHAATDGSTS